MIEEIANGYLSVQLITLYFVVFVFIMVMDTLFSKGFIDWKHGCIRVNEHENEKKNRFNVRVHMMKKTVFLFHSLLTYGQSWYGLLSPIRRNYISISKYGRS